MPPPLSLFAEPEMILDQDMTRHDLVENLAALRFHGESRCLLSLDRPVRDFLVSALCRK